MNESRTSPVVTIALSLLIRQQNYLWPFSVIRKNLLNQRSLEGMKVKHIPHILCHSPTPFPKEVTPLHFALPQTKPLISILIPTKDGLSLLKPCIESILRTVKQLNFEIIIINNQSEKPETLAYLQEIASEQIRILDYSQPFNYPAINNFAAREAKGEVLLLLNNDIEAIHEGWLEEE